MVLLFHFESKNVVSCGVISCWGLDDLCVVDGLVCEDESVTSIINKWQITINIKLLLRIYDRKNDKSKKQVN